MKKYLFMALCVLVVLVLASCATAKAEPVAAPVVPQVLGKNGIPQPAWVMDDESTQDVHSAAGYGKMSNLQNSIKRAEAEARNIIAEWVNIAVDEIVTSYTNDSGEGANRQAIDAFEVVGKQRAQAILSGCTREAYWEDAEGGVWVLMSIPVANVEEQMKGAASEAAGGEAEFKKNTAAQEANKMMNAAIEKYFSNPSVTK